MNDLDEDTDGYHELVDPPKFVLIMVGL